MANFFIRRPIVAIVIAILTVIVGVITIVALPEAQFPNIAPPEIRLQANYPGADAQTLEQAVATPIEQQVSGVDNMTYMYSLDATANQQTQLLVDFDLKTDPNMDLILKQSRQQLANGQFPPEVNNYGIGWETMERREISRLRVLTPSASRPTVRGGVLSVWPWFRQLSAKQQATESKSFPYCSFAYSALASFRMGMSGSASFHSVRKSL